MKTDFVGLFFPNYKRTYTFGAVACVGEMQNSQTDLYVFAFVSAVLRNAIKRFYSFHEVCVSVRICCCFLLVLLLQVEMAFLLIWSMLVTAPSLPFASSSWCTATDPRQNRRSFFSSSLQFVSCTISTKFKKWLFGFVVRKKKWETINV